MLTLTRPRTGRMISGVAIGLAELYRVPVTLVRVFFVVTVLVSPVIMLLYLLLAIAIPDEEKVASLLQLYTPKAALPPRERFERFSKLLVQRLVNPSSTHAAPTTVLAVGLLILAAILELPRAEGTSFYFIHPFLTTLYTSVSQFGMAIFYLSVTAIFLFGWRQQEPSVILATEPRARFVLEGGSAKMIGGVAAGLSRVIGLDAAYLRVILILLNFLTLGIVGAGYLLVWYLEQARLKRSPKEEVAAPEQSPELPIHGRASMNAGLRAAIALLLIVLAFVHVATAFRLFFFNEPFVLGIVMGLIGIALVWQGLKLPHNRNLLWLLCGASVFFSGVYFFASAIGNIQIAAIERFEIIEIIGAISLAYAGLVSLRNDAQTMMLWLALIVALSAAMILLHFTPPAYLAALIRFYDFFYPIIFAGLGLWIAFER